MFHENTATAVLPPETTTETIKLKQVIITDIQRRLAREEAVPLEDLLDLSQEALHALNAAGIRTVKELIFFSNTGITKAFGGKGNRGTRRHIRRINAVLCKQGFTRRMSVRQYNNRIEELKRIIAKE